jgi:hypothetical protein
VLALLAASEARTRESWSAHSLARCPIALRSPYSADVHTISPTHRQRDRPRGDAYLMTRAARLREDGCAAHRAVEQAGQGRQTANQQEANMSASTPTPTIVLIHPPNRHRAVELSPELTTPSAEEL